MRLTIEEVNAAFENFNKWDTYGLVFHLMDKRKITLREIIQIAKEHGIPQGVIQMRRREHLMLQRPFNLKSYEV